MERKLFSFLILIVLLICSESGFGFSKDSLDVDQINTEARKFALIGNFDEAERLFLSIMEIDTNSIVARNNLGILYKLLGRNNDALSVYSEAEDIVRKVGDPVSLDLAKIHLNKGIVYKQKQDFELAFQYMQSAVSIINNGNFDEKEVGLIYNNVGNVYAGMNEWRTALHFYKQGIQIKETLNADGLDISYANCASAYENLERPDSAQMYYDLSIQTKINKYGLENYRLIGVYINYGDFLIRSENTELGFSNLESAYTYLQSALEIAQNNYPPKHPVVSDCYSTLGFWYLSSKDPQRALENYQKAINAVVFDFDSDNYASNPTLENEIISSPTLLIALLGKADALASLYKKDNNLEYLTTSLQTLELANLLTEKMRSEYLGQESKLLLTENARKGYEKAIEIAYELYALTGENKYADMAFSYAEKSKSSVLLASLQEVENKQSMGIPPATQDFERELKFQSDFYKKKLYEERQRETPDSLKLGIWQNKMLYLSQQLDSLSQVISQDYPDYKSKYDNIVFSLEESMHALEKNQALLTYSLTDSALFIFVVTKKKFYISRNEIDSNFHLQIGTISQFLRNNDVGNTSAGDFRAYTSAAYTLYQELLFPVKEFIEDKNLIIVPDGELGYVPFEALLTEKSDEARMDYRALPYLIYNYRINYSYSATLYFNDKKEEKENNGRLMAFAPTYENIGGIESEKFPSNRNYQNDLVQLKYIKEEINSINEIVDGDKFTDYQATEKVFKEKAADYDILHLAMHTLINDDNPMYSQLVFTMNNDTIEENDGLLNVYEVFNLPLSARLAVLSACNTGYGQLRKGEGVMSLARGFIFAGVPSIVMTLWAVEDQSGSKLMSYFYTDLVDGYEIDEALRNAKLQYLKNADQLTAHPYFWSGYVSIGDTHPIFINKSNFILPLLTGLVGLFVIILMIIKRVKLNKMA